MATPITDEEKRKQISVRGVATLEGVDDIKSSKFRVCYIVYMQANKCW